MKIAGIKPTSLHDGIGVNFVIFFQGCLHGCKGCQNPGTWDCEKGYEISAADIVEEIKKYLDMITGVTFSGGEPMLQSDAVYELAKACKEMGLTTTLYTGYTLDKLHLFREIPFLDYVVDGQFQENLKGDYPFRGSSNQKMWKKVGKRLFEEM